MMDGKGKSKFFWEKGGVWVLLCLLFFVGCGKDQKDMSGEAVKRQVYEETDSVNRDLFIQIEEHQENLGKNDPTQNKERILENKTDDIKSKEIDLEDKESNTKAKSETENKRNNIQNEKKDLESDKRKNTGEEEKTQESTEGPNTKKDEEGLGDDRENPTQDSHTICSWGEKTVVGTEICGEIYTIERRCSVCGKTCSEQILSTREHVWEEQWFNPPDCTYGGDGHCRICKICNKVESLPDGEAELGHLRDAGNIIYQSTCQTEGLISYRCTRCGEKLSDQKIPVDPDRHDWWTDEKGVTYCTECGCFREK